MEWQFCEVCGKVVDEYESKCYWCGTPKQDSKVIAKEYSEKQLELKFGD